MEMIPAAADPKSFESVYTRKKKEKEKERDQLPEFSFTSLYTDLPTGTQKCTQKVKKTITML